MLQSEKLSRRTTYIARIAGSHLNLEWSLSRQPGPSYILEPLVVLMIHAYNSSFTRYVAYDYSFAYILMYKGFIGAQQFWYLQWDGHFSSSFIISLTSLFGPNIVSVLPLLPLGLWLAAMTWTIKQISMKFHISDPWKVSFLLVLLIIATTLSTIPQIFQSRCWQVGMFIFLAPLIIFAITLNSAVSKSDNRTEVKVW
jgi:hypothetical protein